MSLGITPASTFGGLEATAQHLQRSLGSPAVESSAPPSVRAKYVDSNVVTDQSLAPNSPPRHPLSGPRVLRPIKVDVGEISMRDNGHIGRQDSDVANLHASHQTAQRFTDEIQRLGAGLERYLRYLKESRQNVGAEHPLWSSRRDDLLGGGEGSGRGANFSAPPRQRTNGGKSPRGLSLSNSIEDGAQLPDAARLHPHALDATTKPLSTSSHAADIVDDTTIVVSPPMNDESPPLDCPSPTPGESPSQPRALDGAEDGAAEDLPHICEFRPLGHDIDNFMLKNGGRLVSLFPVASVSSNTIVSPPWSDSPGGPSGPSAGNGVGRDSSVEITCLEDAIASVEDIRKSASKVHRCVMDEIYAAKQSVDDLQRRMAALTKTHDITVQRLVAATTKLQTTTTALQYERTALQSVLLKFGTSSPLKRGGHQFGGTSPTTPTAGNINDEDELDEDELFGSPKRTIATASSSPLRLSGAAATADVRGGVGTPTPGSPAAGAWSSIPDDYPNDPRLVSILMLPHDMANDVLRSRRQLKMYISLISQLPSALQEHHDTIQRAVEQEWLPAAEDAVAGLYDEKERLYESARLRLAGEL